MKMRTSRFETNQVTTIGLSEARLIHPRAYLLKLTSVHNRVSSKPVDAELH